MMFSMRHRLWRMKFWRVWLATTGQRSLDNIFKYQNIFIVFSLCLSAVMVPKYGIQALLFKPIRSKPQVLTTFWFTWKWLFDNHASNWSFDMVLILYKHLENVFFQKPTLGVLTSWILSFLTIFRLEVYGTVYESFRRHNRISSRADYTRQQLLVQVNWVLLIGMGFLQPWED